MLTYCLLQTFKMLATAETLKPHAPWSWKHFFRRQRPWLQLLGLLTLALLVVGCCSLLLQFYWNKRLFLVRLSSPISPLQADHPHNLAAPASLPASGDVSAASHRAPQVFEDPSLEKTQRFFRAATTAAAEGGLVLQWGEATIRMLRGAGVDEIFFLFYEPPQTPAAPGTQPEVAADDAVKGRHNDPLQVFKKLAEEDRQEQQQHQLPFVAVPRQEMHRLSFFLPEAAEKMLPLAMVVRLNSGWMKFPAPLKAPYSLPAMKDFLSCYRQGEPRCSLAALASKAVKTEQQAGRQTSPPKCCAAVSSVTDVVRRSN